jgi:hypothetical protein
MGPLLHSLVSKKTPVVIDSLSNRRSLPQERGASPFPRSEHPAHVFCSAGDTVRAIRLAASIARLPPQREHLAPDRLDIGSPRPGRLLGMRPFLCRARDARLIYSRRETFRCQSHPSESHHLSRYPVVRSVTSHPRKSWPRKLVVWIFGIVAAITLALLSLAERRR